MSEHEKKEGASLTSGFTTTAEIRRKQDHHEGVYSDKKILIPTLIVAAAGAAGLILSFLG